MRVALAAMATMLVAGTALAGGLFDEDDCRYTAPRRVAAALNGVTRVVVHADSGSLTVTGGNVNQVVAAGTACTSDEDFLDRMTLTMRRSGSELYIEANIPEKVVLFGFFQARLDFSVSLPAGMPVTIDDGSGWMKVANTGITTIHDDSGSIEVRGVRGNLTIHDDSGAIDIDGVTGNVNVEDDSGELAVKNIGGSVEIEDDSGSITVARVEGSLRVRQDDSGSITVTNVRRDVTIDDDSSGAIDVADIGGNFTVGHKGSGSIDYARVAGRVSIPEEKKRR
ncbi:MAG TPA: hypothetical protein VF824_10280 [Thermoanaerobaculia bacterium]|jgi:hypothetical protein